jgi:hypothetical protein
MRAAIRAANKDVSDVLEFLERNRDTTAGDLEDR